MIQLACFDDDELRPHAMQNLKRLLFGKVLNDHAVDILDSTGIVEDYLKQLLRDLLDECIVEEICSGYSQSFCTVKGRNTWEA